MICRTAIRFLLAAISAAATVTAGPALAAPTIANISPHGLQIGRPTTLVITGSDLSADVRIVSEVKIASQKVSSGARSTQVEIEVTVDTVTPPGIYTVRLADAGGVSGPVVLGVDRLPQRAFAPALGELPAALSGAVGAAQVLTAKLPGKKGQRVVLDVEAQRLGSGLKPVIRLYNARGTQIAWSPPRPNLGGDARVELALPADAEYTIELHDELYRPAGPGFFRLKIGDLQYADLVLPLGVAAGSKQHLHFASSHGAASAELDATAIKVPGEIAAPLPADKEFTGAAPRLAISDFPELLESPAPDHNLQELQAAPIGVSGVLTAAGEEDKYLLPVKPMQKLRFDCVARQFGSPLDAVLTIRKPDGSQLAMGDDRPGSSDPLVDFTVPAGVEKIEVAIKDLLGRGGGDFVYRIVVRDQSRPDFSLSLATDKVNIPAGGTQVIPVQVSRTNYNGPIELSLENQPSELALQGHVIAPGATIGLLTLSAQSVSPQATLTRFIGRAVESQPLVLRAAVSPDVPGGRYQPRVRNEVGLAITRPSPIGLAWIPGENDQLYLGGKMPARVQLTRADGTQGKIRLKLLTSQPTPKKTVKERNQDKTVDDVDRTLRLEGDPTFGPDQKEVTVHVLVPSDLPRQPWDLVLVAELLSADGKNVVSSLAAPVRTLSPVAPFTLALTGDGAAEGKAGTGEAGRLRGTVSRVAGYTQPVLVTLENLPQDYTAPQVLVPGDKADFELPLTFPFKSKPGELKGARLVALAAPLVATSVKSNAVDVSIKVVPGDKPVTEQPKEVFEDDEKFIAMLTEGGGRAIPDQRDQFSGKYSLRVTPDQKFNPKLPNLGVKIRENPGPGEFRYLRFAWKKVQGNAICLQLAHDGKFGPAGNSGGRDGAKFRYHAGPGEECFGASLQVSDKTPVRFEVVTRDLFTDFGEFTLTGLGFSPVDGQSALFDHIYLARQLEDFELLKVEK
jgi:hypothetical protein